MRHVLPKEINWLLSKARITDKFPENDIGPKGVAYFWRGLLPHVMAQSLQNFCVQYADSSKNGSGIYTIKGDDYSTYTCKFGDKKSTQDNVIFTADIYDHDSVVRWDAKH